MMATDNDICPDMQGLTLIEDTGWGEKHWADRNNQIRFLTRDTNDGLRMEINRWVFRVSCDIGIDDWEEDEEWGGVMVIADDDGRAVIAVRSRDYKFTPSLHRALVFASSETFWIKTVLKYRGQNAQ